MVMEDLCIFLFLNFQRNKHESRSHSLGGIVMPLCTIVVMAEPRKDDIPNSHGEPTLEKEMRC
jgi:hypothetical protein